MTQAVAATVSPQEQIMGFIMIIVQGRCVVAAAELELSDVLAKGPLPVETIAGQAQADVDHVFGKWTDITMNDRRGRSGPGMNSGCCSTAQGLRWKKSSQPHRCSALSLVGRCDANRLEDQSYSKHYRHRGSSKRGEVSHRSPAQARTTGVRARGSYLSVKWFSFPRSSGLGMCGR